PVFGLIICWKFQLRHGLPLTSSRTDSRTHQGDRRHQGARASGNLGTGRGHSIRDVISAVEAASRRTIPVAARRSGDPPALIANPQLGQSLLGWKPLKSDLHTIVQTAWGWHQSRPLSPIAELPARKTRDQAAAIH